MLDNGIIELDITIDRMKEALKDPNWREGARKVYKEASSKALTEAEKDVIRKEYIKVLSAYATYGNGMPDNQNP